MPPSMQADTSLTPSTVIDKLGGNQAVARLLGVGVSAVSNYRRDGFPPRIRWEIDRACQEIGIYLTPDFFERFTPSRRLSGHR